ncbi:RNA-directed DNA polymerase, eukaryota [Tanacetum coccineum]
MPSTLVLASKKFNKVVFEEDSESEVEEVQNETANFMASKLLRLIKGSLVELELKILPSWDPRLSVKDNSNDFQILFGDLKKVGEMGEATSFWNDVWLGDFPLKQTDRWSWLLDPSGDFSVKSTREFIDDSMLPKTDVPTRWVKSILIKINIFAWRVSLDKLPTRLNLSLRGLDTPSIICPLCSIAVESTSHLLFSSQLARRLMIRVVHWWELEYQEFHSYED